MATWAGVFSREKNPFTDKDVSFVMRKFASVTLRPTAIAAEINLWVHEGRFF